MILHVSFVVLLFGAVLPSRDANDRRLDNAKKNYIVGFESTDILPSDVELLVGGVDKAHLRQLDNEGSVHLVALTEEQSQKVSLHCCGWTNRNPVHSPSFVLNQTRLHRR